jgi:hypothetical protein
MEINLSIKGLLIGTMVLFGVTVFLLSNLKPSYAAGNVQFKVVCPETGSRFDKNLENILNNYTAEGWRLEQMASTCAVFKK